eukprot:17074-Heterococcus_DN1.PRE.2
MDDLDKILKDVTAAGESLDFDDLLGPAPTAARSSSSSSNSYNAPARSSSPYAARPGGRDAYGSSSSSSSSRNDGYRSNGYSNGPAPTFGGAAAGAPSRRPSFNAAMGDKIIVDLEAKAEVDSKDVDPETVAVLRNKGITHFTPVQAQTYEHILAGRDMVARSRTGVYVGRKNSLQNGLQNDPNNCAIILRVALLLQSHASITHTRSICFVITRAL